MDTNALTTIDHDGQSVVNYVPDIPDAETFQAQLDAMKQEALMVMDFVKSMMTEGEDFGTIPGTYKPTLYDPGAQKLLKLFRYRHIPELISKAEDDTRGYFEYTYKVRVYNGAGQLVTEGYGSCNSFEDKYRFTWLWDNQVSPDLDKTQLTKRFTKTGKTQYRVQNPSEAMYDIKHTLMLMAIKRARVAAARSATWTSGIFTQDMEHLRPQWDEAWQDLLKFGKRLGYTTTELGQVLKAKGYRSQQDLPDKLEEMCLALVADLTNQSQQQAQPRAEPKAAEVAV